jgi:outer membrane immunogenic protein
MRKLIAVAGILACAGAAQADGPGNWSGLYVGVHGGWATGAWDGTLVYDPGTGPAPGIFDPAERSIDGSGWLFGGQIGFNVQSGAFVLGIEIDGAWTDIKGEDTFTTVDFGGDGKKDYTWKIGTKLDAFGTVRGRLGVAAGESLLLFGTAGLAFGRTTGDLTVTGYDGQGFPASGQVTAIGSATENHIGWAGGGGLEWRLTRTFSLKAEYLYVDLGDAAYRLVGTAYPGTPGAFPHTTDSFPADLTFHSVRIGGNIRFGD